MHRFLLIHFSNNWLELMFHSQELLQQNWSGIFQFQLKRFGSQLLKLKLNLEAIFVAFRFVRQSFLLFVLDAPFSTPHLWFSSIQYLVTFLFAYRNSFAWVAEYLHPLMIWNELLKLLKVWISPSKFSIEAILKMFLPVLFSFSYFLGTLKEFNVIKST